MTNHPHDLDDSWAEVPIESTTAPRPGADKEAAQHALDDLFAHAQRYRTSDAYRDLLKFVARFRLYSPFNAMLLHIQMSGARYVAPASRWWRKYKRVIRPTARPLVILQPMGPVMFVFDVSDTEPTQDAPGLPQSVEHPFEVRSGRIRGEFKLTGENAKRDGILISEHSAGSQHAGSLQSTRRTKALEFQVRARAVAEYVSVPLRYELLLNSNFSEEAKYATLAHELGHLYCGHLGTPDVRWWPDRRGLSKQVCEFEAESVCYLVCERLGIDNPSAEYLSGHVGTQSEIPAISVGTIFKAAALIEQMGRQRMKPRKAPG